MWKVQALVGVPFFPTRPGDCSSLWRERRGLCRTGPVGPGKGLGICSELLGLGAPA